MMSMPLTDIEFSNLIDALGPFEAAPHLAVAVSGGADSTALAWLAHHWARARGGQVTALTVDHGLRPEATAEAEAVAQQLNMRGIAHQTLTWSGPKPSLGLQAAARQARYGLLENWCRANAVVHLLVGHHAGDQAETFLMRAERGSGPDGLAAMAPVRELSACRILRPLLSLEKTRLMATAQAAELVWVEDPSNDNVAFQRVRVRHALQDGGIDTQSLAQGTVRFAGARAVLETETARWLARHVTLNAAGYAALSLDALEITAPEIVHRGLARLVAAVGGKPYAPSPAAIERVYKALTQGDAATLGAVRVCVEIDRIGIYREARNQPTPLTFSSNAQAQTHHWDGRFAVHIAPETAPLSCAAFSDAVFGYWPKRQRPDWFLKLPVAARAGLLVFRQKTNIVVPKPGSEANMGIRVAFQPKNPLAGNGFSIA